MATDMPSGPPDGMAPPTRERRVETPIVVGDTIGSNALARQYRAEHVPTRAPHETTALLLTRAGDRLEYPTVAHYMLSARDAIRHRRVPADVRLSEDAKRLALGAPLSWVTEDWHHVERPWEVLPGDELLTLLSVGFGEDARHWELSHARAAGELDSATLDWDDYLTVYQVDRQPEAIFVVFFGWVPGAVAGVVAAIVAGVVTGSFALALGIAIGAPILGYALTFIRASLLDAQDREHHLGDDYQRRFSRLYFGSGPIVAVALSMLAPLAHSLA